MFKNVAAKFIVFAFDATTNVPKTGDAANITAYVSIDYGTVTVLGDTSATEFDATNAPGYYWFTAAQGETNGDCLMVTGKSATANIKILGAPAIIYTRPTTGWLAPTTAGRTLDVSATGEAGVDWANVGGPTTTVDLSNTTIKTTQKVDVDTIKTNPVVNGGTITFPTTATLASTTNITAGTITTTTNLTNLPSIPANWLTAAGINAGALNGKGDWSTVTPTNLTAAQIATGVWQDTTAGDFTVSASIGKSVMNGVALGTGLTINGYTGNTVQTGDSFARIGAAGVSLSAIPDLAGVTTLLARITATRAGYIDNLSAGAVALASGVTVSTNNDKTAYSLTAAYDAAKTAAAATDIVSGGAITTSGGNASADVKKMNGVTVIGTGIASDLWRA